MLLNYFTFTLLQSYKMKLIKEFYLYIYSLQNYVTKICKMSPYKRQNRCYTMTMKIVPTKISKLMTLSKLAVFLILKNIHKKHSVPRYALTLNIHKTNSVSSFLNYFRISPTLKIWNYKY